MSAMVEHGLLQKPDGSLALAGDWLVNLVNRRL